MFSHCLPLFSAYTQGTTKNIQSIQLMMAFFTYCNTTRAMFNFMFIYGTLCHLPTLSKETSNVSSSCFEKGCTGKSSRDNVESYYG